MEVNVACHPCFLRQAVRLVRLNGGSAELEQAVHARIEKLLAELDSAATPVDWAARVYAETQAMTGWPDPYHAIKRQCNAAVRTAVDAIRREAGSALPFDRALRHALAGNAIDFGVTSDFDLDAVLARVMRQRPVVDASPRLREDLAGARSVAYFCDNAGEIGFDRLLIETIFAKFSPERVLVVVRASPFINDALIEDARAVGLDAIPGVELRELPVGAPEPRGPVWDEAMACDVIIAKGQANYEAFSELDRFYFLFLVKCELVREQVTRRAGQPVAVGDMIVYHR